MFTKAETKKDLEHFLPDPGKDPRAHETRTEGCQKATSMPQLIGLAIGLLHLGR